MNTIPPTEYTHEMALEIRKIIEDHQRAMKAELEIRSNKEIVRVFSMIKDMPNMTMDRVSSETGISRETLYKILLKGDLEKQSNEMIDSFLQFIEKYQGLLQTRLDIESRK